MGEDVKKYQIPGFSIGLAKDGQLFYEIGSDFATSIMHYVCPLKQGFI